MFRRVLLCRVRGVLAAAVVLALPMVVPSSAAAAGPSNPEVVEQHCSVTVTGKKASGELTTTKPVCSAQRPSSADRVSAASSVIATHHTGFNYSGSTFTVHGACDGGYVNFPREWTTVISSTWSYCTVTHFDYFYATGDVEVTYSPSNLSSLNNKVNSARYS